jgi:hypothetical protein
MDRSVVGTSDVTEDVVLFDIENLRDQDKVKAHADIVVLIRVGSVREPGFCMKS